MYTTDDAYNDHNKASTMLEHNEKYGVVLGFDVPVTRDAQELADSFKPPIKVWLISSDFSTILRMIFF